jgi:predicted permease
MLARLHLRLREMAIRTALGATRLTLIAQLLSESFVLAACGGLLGIPFSFALLRILLAVNPGSIVMPDQIHINTAALIFTVVCSAACGVMSGLAPALRAKNVDVAGSIAEAGRNASVGFRHSKLRPMLAVLEIAMAFILLTGAGLLLRSFLKLTSVNPGFDSRNLLTFSVALPEGRYKTQAQVNQFVDNLLRSIRRSSAVTVAAAGTSLPIGPTDYGVFIRADAASSVAGLKPASTQLTTPEYLQTLGIPLKHGRRLEETDRVSRTPVALVNEAMAKQAGFETDAVGKQLVWVTAVGIRTITIAGVVGDLRQDGLASSAEPTVYVPIEQAPVAPHLLVFAIRGTASTSIVASEVKRAITEIDRGLPVFALQSGTELIAHSVGNERFNAFVVIMFAAGALALAVSGLYAVISYLVIHSSQELGVRIALGARRRQILRMVMGRGLGYVAAGLLLGVTAALNLTQVLRSMLFGIDRTDPATFVGVMIVLTTVTAFAVLIPAVRATRVDPVVSLRYE